MFPLSLFCYHKKRISLSPKHSFFHYQALLCYLFAGHFYFCMVVQFMVFFVQRIEFVSTKRNGLYNYYYQQLLVIFFEVMPLMLLIHCLPISTSILFLYLHFFLPVQARIAIFYFSTAISLLPPTPTAPPTYYPRYRCYANGCLSNRNIIIIISRSRVIYKVNFLVRRRAQCAGFYTICLTSPCPQPPQSHFAKRSSDCFLQFFSSCCWRPSLCLTI